MLKTEEEIINELIEREVQRQEAERRNITVDVDAIYESLLENHRMLEQSASAGNAQAQADLRGQEVAIEAMGYDSPEEYYRYSAETSESAAAIAELRRQWIATSSSANSNAAYEAFVDTLVSKAEIVYLD